MKALIPVAGAGTRLRPHTYTQPKPLIPVAGKPIIASIVDDLLSYGIEDFIFVIGYLGDKIQAYIEKRYPELNTEFVYQEERKGLGHAIWTARSNFENCEEILIVLGDTIFDADLNKILNAKNSCLAVKKVEDPREFGVVVLNDDGYIKQVVEKPRIPKSNMAIVGIYKINDIPNLIEALEYIIHHNVRTKDEFQLTDALMRMVEAGSLFTVCPIDHWFDCGKKDILLETNAMLLKRKANPQQEFPNFKNTIIIPPVSIGQNCKISNSIIGPHVSVGDHAILEHAIIQNSIIGNYAAIEEAVLHRSVIGNDALVKGLSQSLNIGDNTEIDFS
jgi:glucose-1-phosphate thymidylyltransferase